MHIHADHCDDDMTLDEFNKFCRKVWKTPPGHHNFVTIDLTSGKLDGQYRKNLDCFYLSSIDIERITSIVSSTIGVCRVNNASIMFFLNIKDPQMRDAIVIDYLATVKRFQQKNLNEKAEDLARRDDIELALEQVVRSTRKSTEAITKELIPTKNEIKALEEAQENDREEHQQEQEEREESEYESQPNIVQVYYQKVPKREIE